MWRRQATGTVAEILGRRELGRDIGARLHMFRGDLDADLNRYHPHGKQIVEAYVRGVNAYIAETERNSASRSSRERWCRCFAMHRSRRCQRKLATC
jgi:penicillin G amidase